MWIFRVLLLVILITALGVGILFYDDVKPKAEGMLSFYKGDHAYKNGHYAEARDFYREAVKSYPWPEIAYVRLGDAQLALARKSAAMSAYRKALEINPECKEALPKLAKLEWEADNRYAALDLYLEALHANPEDARLKQEVADLYLKEARETGNKKYYQRAASIFKQYEGKPNDDPLYRYKLAESLFAQEKYDEALNIYCELTEKNPDNPETLYSLAAAFAKNGAYQEAAEYMAVAAVLADTTQPALAQRWASHAITLKGVAQNSHHEPTPAASACAAKLEKLTAHFEDEAEK